MKSPKFKRSKINYINYNFLIPALILIFVFFLVPNILNFIYSFTDWNTFKTELNFVGLRNFIELTIEKTLWRDLLTTFKYAIFVTIVSNILGLAIALALEKTSKINGIYRTLFFIPLTIAPLAAGYLFKGIFDTDGTLNYILSIITNRDINFQWLGKINIVIFMVGLVQVWKWLGLRMIIYIAGLNAIPKELIEAAKVEGSNFWQILKNIQIPLIGPSLTFNITMSFVTSLFVFDTVVSMTRGGPARASEVANLFILYKFGEGRFSYATTMSLILFLIICVVSIPLITFFRKRELEL